MSLSSSSSSDSLIESQISQITEAPPRLKGEDSFDYKVRTDPIYRGFYELLRDGASTKEIINYSNSLKKLDKNYRYLITFTLRESEPHSEDLIQEYIIKQFKRKALKIESAYITKEYTKNNVAHWHVACQSLKFISKDRFQHYIKKYGNIDISKTHSQTLKSAIEYISKEFEPLQIV